MRLKLKEQDVGSRKVYQKKVPTLAFQKTSTPRTLQLRGVSLNRKMSTNANKKNLKIRITTSGDSPLKPLQVLLMEKKNIEFKDCTVLTL